MTKMIITKISKYSWFKIETERIIIHIDPGYAGYYQNQGFDESLFTQKANVVLITHHHKDHLQPVVVDKICNQQTVIYAPYLCHKLLSRSFQIVQPGYSDQINGLKLRVVAAYNTTDGSSTRKPHHTGECVGFIFEIDRQRIYHAGDTDLIPEMYDFGGIDIACLPIGGTFTMDITEALQAVDIIKPRLVIPMHSLKANPQEFLNRLKANTAYSGLYLRPGEQYVEEGL